MAGEIELVREIAKKFSGKIIEVESAKGTKFVYVEFKDRKSFEACLSEVSNALKNAPVNRLRSEAHFFLGNLWICIKHVE